MDEPEIVFSHWFRWADRKLLENANSPGVYHLAHFDAAPEGPADPLAREIIYIGETCDNSLKRRWRQFHRSAFEGKFGHAGGVTYREKYPDTNRNLYVAAFSAGELDDYLRAPFIRFVERKLLWEYARKWRRLPECNRK